MKHILKLMSMVAGMAVLTSPATRAEDTTNTARTKLPPTARLSLSPEERQARMQELSIQRPVLSREEMEKIRSELRGLPPEERAAKIRELRQKYVDPNSAEMQKRREELSKLSPEERRARFEELRKSNAGAALLQTRPNDDRRAELQERLETLRTRKAEGQLTPQEEQQLERIERGLQLMRDRSEAAKVVPAEPADPGKDSPKN
jgi:ribosomal protein L29